MIQPRHQKANRGKEINFTEALHSEARATDWEESPEGVLPSEAEAVARAACEIASTLKVEVIVTVTLEGATARLVAKYRPSPTILAVTSQVETYRRLALIRGVVLFLLSSEVTTREAMIEKAKEKMRASGLQGKRIVIVSSISPEQNFLTTAML